MGLGAVFATVVLPRVVPMGAALELLYTGRYIGAEEALRMGLVGRVVELDQMLPTAVELARTIAHNAPLSIRRMKLNAWRSLGLPVSAVLALDLGPDPYASADRDEG